MNDLLSKKCIPCEGEGDALSLHSIHTYLKQVDGWQEGVTSQEIFKEFTFKDFAQALAFTNQIGVVAEQEGHHPDISLSWGKVVVTLTTHAIGALTENDFILAAKIDAILQK